MKKALIVGMSVLMMFALAACGGGADTFTESTEAPAQEVKIIATNWKFDQPEYKVKKGEPFTLTLDVQEGVHGIKVEGMSGSLAAKPGETTSKTVVANKEGSYLVICNVACGSGHSQMKARLIVE